MPRERGWVRRGSGLLLGLGGRSGYTFLTDNDNEDGFDSNEQQIEESKQNLNLVSEVQEPHSKEEEVEVWSCQVE
jgi:hypothetical protein